MNAAIIYWTAGGNTIRGRPNAQDLARVREDAHRLAKAMQGG